MVRRRKQFIVKVQVSVGGMLGRVLMYDRRRQYEWEGPVGEDVLEVMAGRPKAFFFAEINEKRQIALNAEAPEQDW